jgi:hypothetical protein
MATLQTLVSDSLSRRCIDCDWAKKPNEKQEYLLSVGLIRSPLRFAEAVTEATG